VDNIFYIETKTKKQRWGEIYSNYNGAIKRYTALVAEKQFVIMQIIDRENSFNNFYEDWKKEKKGVLIYNGERNNGNLLRPL